MAFPYKSILFLCISSTLQANEESQQVALIKKPPQTEVQKTKRQVLAGTHTPENEPACDLGSHAIQISARHVQGAGVGYSRGYTTLEGFLSPSRCYEQWTPFIDLRGHVFNNAKLAANAGLGLRYVNSITWGANAYYDYRRTHQYHYNQVGAGFEAIGSFWSVSLNGYLPVGKKRSSFYDPSITGTGQIGNFGFFQGNQLFLILSGTQALTAKQEFAFKGINANFAFRPFKKGLFSLDLEIGPYYFQGYYKKYAAGGQGRVTARFAEYFSLSLIGSYDNLFHDRIQGAAAFSIPLGPRSFGKKCSKPTCTIPSFFDSRLARGSDRNEIVVVDRHEKILTSAAFGGTQVAIDPSTGLPYTIWFVNNTSHSDGTYESPFPTLLEAQTISQANDLIYVYEGDGTNMGMDAGILLKDSQQLLGSGTPVTISTTLGPIVIPAQTVGSPLITNAGATTVTLANNNTVSGIHIGTSTTGIFGTGIQNAILVSNQIESDSVSIQWTDFIGTGTVTNNSLSLYTNTGFIFSSSLSTPSSTTISGNTFTALAASPGTVGINASTTNSAQAGLNVSNCTFTEHTNVDLLFSCSNSSVLNPTIAANTITAPGGSSTTAIQLNPLGSSMTLNVTNNNLLNHTQNALAANTDFGCNLSAAISSNTTQGVAGTSLKGINLSSSNTATGLWNVTIQNNTCSDYTQADIYLNPRGTTTVASTIANNTSIGAAGGTSTNGIQLDADDTSIVTLLNITGNQSSNHTAAEIAVTARGTMAQITTDISNNQLTTTGGVVSGNGIQLNSNNAGTFGATVSNNTISNMNNTGISIASNNNASFNGTVSGNHVTAPVGVANTTAIGFNSNNNGSLTINVLDNTLLNHTGLSLSSFINDGGSSSSMITGNTVQGITGTSAKGISIATGNTATGNWSTTIQNNSLSGGFTQADIYLDPQGTSTLTSAVISGNTVFATADNTSPNGIQVDVDNTANITSLQITNNQVRNHTSSEIILTLRGTANQATATISGNETTSTNTTSTFNSIQLNAQNGAILGAMVTNNTCGGNHNNGIQINTNNTAVANVTLTSNTLTDHLQNGIQTNSMNSSTLTATATNNQLTAPLGVASNGIQFSLNDTATMASSFISNNTLLHHDAFSIQINYAGSNISCHIEDNTLSLGSVTGQAFGILANLAGSNAVDVIINNNTITTESGNIGSQFGIVCGIQSSNMPAITQTVPITNNRITNCGNAPPLFGFTAGIAAALESADNFIADVESNTLVNCGTSGFGGVLGARINIGTTPGHMCWTLVNNTSDTGYSLYNDPPSGMATDFNLNASGNTGTVTPVAGSPFSTAPCPL